MLRGRSDFAWLALRGRPREVRVLVTGFAPFGVHRWNSSWEVARRLAADPPPGVEVTALRLPVDRQRAAAVLLPLLDHGGFDAWVGLGEADGRQRLSIEEQAINRFGAPSEQLIAGGPPAYPSRFRTVKLAAAMERAGVPARVSGDAGNYVCNALSYLVYHHLAQTRSGVIAGFIHLPYLPTQVEVARRGAASLPLDVQVRGVGAALETIAERVMAARPR